MSKTGKKLVYIALAAILVLLYLEVAYTHGKSMFALLFYDGKDSFMDFFNSIVDGASMQPYQNGCIYPPLAYLFLLVFSMFIPQTELADYTYAEHYWDVKLEQGWMVSLLFFLLFAIVLCSAMTYCMKQGKSTERALFTFLILFNLPFIHGLERGNMIILAYGFTMAFLGLKDSQSRTLRELSYICLAAAAGLKIYPAVFGLLLLEEHRYADAVRTAVYGAILFFAPFLAFGGLQEVNQLFTNIGDTVSKFNASDAVLRLDFYSFITYFFRWAHLPDVLGELAANLYRIVFGVIAIIGVFRTIKPWKRMLFLALMMIGIPGFSIAYTGVFLVIPLIALFDTEPMEKSDIKYLLILFLILFAIPFTNNPTLQSRDYYKIHSSFHDYVASGGVFLLSLMMMHSALADTSGNKEQNELKRQVRKMMK